MTFCRENRSPRLSSSCTASGIPSMASCVLRSSKVLRVISALRRSSTVRTASVTLARPSHCNAVSRLDERRTSSTEGSWRRSSVLFAVTLVFHQMLISRTSEHLAQLVAMAAAHLQLRAVIEIQQVVAALQWTILLHAVEVHDRTAMDATELPRIEALLDRVDGGTDTKLLSRRMNVHVIGGGGQVVNFRNRLQENAVGRPDNNLLRIFAHAFFRGISAGLHVRCCR